MRTQTIRTEIVMRDDDKTTLLVNNVCALRRQNQRLARERSVFIIAFAVTLVALVCVFCAGR